MRDGAIRRPGKRMIPVRWPEAGRACPRDAIGRRRARFRGARALGSFRPVAESSRNDSCRRF